MKKKRRCVLGQKSFDIWDLFLQPNLFGLNTFYMAFEMIYIDQFMYLNFEITKKNN